MDPLSGAVSRWLSINEARRMVLGGAGGKAAALLWTPCLSRTTRPYRLEQLPQTGSPNPRAQPRTATAGAPAPTQAGAGHQAAAAAVVQAGAGLSRASAELTAVTSDVARGVHAILGICEE